MGDWNQIYLTAHGSWTSGSQFHGEHAQMGLRLTTEIVDDVPGLGQEYTPRVNAASERKIAVVSHAEGTLHQQWEAQVGTAPIDELIGAQEQIDMALDFRTFLNAIKQYVTADFVWTQYKIALVNPNGRYDFGSSVFIPDTLLNGTGTAGNTLPPENAIAMSLRAPVIGRKGRGRMYLPALVNTVTTSGRVNSTVRTTLANAMVQLLADLQDAPGVDWVNRYTVAVTSAGALTAIRPSEVRIGDLMDVQKRRQAQVDETYTSVSLT